MKIPTFPILFAWIACCCFTPQKNSTVQVDISALLNARPVTTLANGKLTSWTKGIDGNGDGDGYLTQSAAAFNGDKDAHALPDDPLFLANGSHPEIALHYNNNDSLHYQARYVSGAGEFTIPVTKGRYSAIYLALTSSEGSCGLQFELIYTDGPEIKKRILPDYYNNISPKDPDLSYVVTDLAKWGKKSIMAEKDHHNIHLLKMAIDPHRKLKAITVKKSKEGYLVFWSATMTTAQSN